VDRHVAGEDAVLVSKFVAVHGVGVEQGEGRFRDLARSARDQDDFDRVSPKPRDELLCAGERPEVPRCPQDLGLVEPTEALGPQAEPLFPVDSSIDARAGDGGDLGSFPDEGGEFRQEFVRNQGVL
jgi:hypothetical protein